MKIEQEAVRQGHSQQQLDQSLSSFYSDYVQKLIGKQGGVGRKADIHSIKTSIDLSFQQFKNRVIPKKINRRNVGFTDTDNFNTEDLTLRQEKLFENELIRTKTSSFKVDTKIKRNFQTNS